MALEYKVVELPPVWPGKRTPYPRRAPFKTQWARTIRGRARDETPWRAQRGLDVVTGSRTDHHRAPWRLTFVTGDGALMADAPELPPVVTFPRDAVLEAVHVSLPTESHTMTLHTHGGAQR